VITEVFYVTDGYHVKKSRRLKDVKGNKEKQAMKCLNRSDIKAPVKKDYWGSWKDNFNENVAALEQNKS